MKIIPYSKHSINQKDINAVVRTLKSNSLTQGNKIDEFEFNLKKYFNCKYVVAVSSASAGLHITLKALGFNNLNKLITTPITFCSTINSALHLGGKVIFSDIDIKTGNISKEHLEQTLKKNKKIKVIMPVHFGGCTNEMNNIYKLAKKNNAYLVEDASHSLGSKYEDGSKVGSCKFSDVTIFSLHAIKTITTGEGGIIATNNKKIYERLILLRSHGIQKNPKKFKLKISKKNEWPYEVHELGFNYRITDIQCSLGISQLSRINKFLDLRKKIAKRYDKAFKNNKFFFPLQNNLRENNSNHLYVILINFKNIKKNKTQLIRELKNNGVLTQIHYTPLFMQPLYQKKFKIKKKQFLNTVRYFKECLSLPIHPDLSMRDQHRVISSILRLVK